VVFLRILRIFRSDNVALRQKLHYCSQCCRSGSGQIRTFLVGSGRLGPDPDPDHSLNECPYINYFGACKRHKYFMNLCYLNFWFMNTGTLFRVRYISAKKISRRKLSENLFRSGSGSRRFRKSSPDTVKNRPDPQH
jgi:hypothetical protein